MPDLINSIKRLERAGNNNSKANQKLHEADRKLRSELSDCYPDMSPSAIAAVVASRDNTDTLADLVNEVEEATAEQSANLADE